MFSMFVKAAICFQRCNHFLWFPNREKYKMKITLNRIFVNIYYSFIWKRERENTAKDVHR